MSFGEEAQNTWDKIRGKSHDGETLNEQMDDESNMDTQEALASDDGSEMEMPAASPEGFREHLGQEDLPLAGDMAGDSAMTADEMPDEAVEAELDSDRDYDTDMEESSADGFTDRDSF